LAATDGVLAVMIAALVMGSVVSFGGAVWWFCPAVATLAFLLVCTRLVQLVVQGRMPFLKSPLTLLGLLVLALGVLQSIPLPPRLARQISPVAHQVYASGGWPQLVRSDDPAAEMPEPASVRSPATLDRAATLRWLVGAAICLGIFWTVSHFVDRLGRLYLVWGSIVAGFLLNGALGLVQITGQSEGLFGVLVPERAPIWGPSLDDLLESPATAALRRLGDPSSARGSALEPIALVPDRPFLFGTLMGGPSAFLAIGSMGLPLALAILIHVVAPRGSRESFSDRLGHSQQGGLVILLTILLGVSAFLAGLMAGPWFCLPFAGALALVGFPSAMIPGSRWSAIGLTTFVLTSLALGGALSAAWPALLGGLLPVAPVSWESTRLVWTECLPVVQEFPFVGTGFGSFRTVHPYFKTQDASPTVAMSSLLQWGVESGSLGLGILGLAALWCVYRLPGCLKRVGSADRTLAYGLIGAVAGLSLWFSVQWTLELPAVAISASALVGTGNRWLAGGTDLFVERG
jgi:hypothetical protein